MRTKFTMRQIEQKEMCICVCMRVCVHVSRSKKVHFILCLLQFLYCQYVCMRVWQRVCPCQFVWEENLSERDSYFPRAAWNIWVVPAPCIEINTPAEWDRATCFSNGNSAKSCVVTRTSGMADRASSSCLRLLICRAEEWLFVFFVLIVRTWELACVSTLRRW